MSSLNPATVLALDALQWLMPSVGTVAYSVLVNDLLDVNIFTK
jgi:hypothetical protein